MSKELKKKRKYNQNDVLNLFVRSGGCCTFCKKYLFEEWMTHMKTNIGEKCHIRAFALYGPRGKDNCADEKEINGYDNLVLGCPTCHSGIDQKIIDNVISIDKIKEMKKNHEDMIRKVLSNVKNKEYEIVKYYYPIANSKVTIDDNAIRMSAFESLLFTDSNIINLSGNEIIEGDVESAKKNIDEKFKALIFTRLVNNENLNICLFAFAPIYQLIYLGTLLNDKYNVIPFILRRNPTCWDFEKEKQVEVTFDYLKPKNVNMENEVALVVNTTAKIDNHRVINALSDNSVDIWEINASAIGYDNISTLHEIEEFSCLFKKVVEQIGTIYGKNKTINIFPATSNAISISIGRCYSNKSNNKFAIYDTNNNGQTFKKVLEI